MNFACWNGKILPAEEAVLSVQNRGFKWGDALFETMKLYKGRILLEELHFERLFSGLQLLQMKAQLSVEELRTSILRLADRNNCIRLARIRLSVFRDDMAGAGYTIEALPLTEDTLQWDPRGLSLTIYPYAIKPNDAFANLKSANYLPYVMASLHAKQNSFGDALLLNHEHAIADSSRANLFLFNNEELWTPALHQGCVNGVMRRFLIDRCKQKGIAVHQRKITEADLLEADEMFLTNAIQGMRWVKSYKGKNYTYLQTKTLFESLRTELYL